ncbi:hypothetical protein LJR039_005017 [Pseudorhodoferax sp. LjRoot39]|uniref:hypothetical protein n=1 Tax=Pseudorhodoferax sp. LjRoot39 TaxID=3342328 RepID=UPI003ECCE1E6
MKRVSLLLSVLAGALVLGAVLAPRKDPAIAAEPEKKAAPEKPLTAAEKKAQQEKFFGPETIVAAQRAVRATLKDPDSAQFKEVYANYTEAFDLVACGSVNAKNSVGGYTGFKRFVSSGKSVILEGRDNLADAWAKACR